MKYNDDGPRMIRSYSIRKTELTVQTFYRTEKVGTPKRCFVCGEGFEEGDRIELRKCLVQATGTLNGHKVFRKWFFRHVSCELPGRGEGR